MDSFKWYVGPTLAEYIEGWKLMLGLETVLHLSHFLSVHDVYKDKGN